ncbi:MAG: hypothetical protein OEY03_04105 [Rhizobacter sp.]|nr:hypothetical protein [Rhizobacter sp.]
MCETTNGRFVEAKQEGRWFAVRLHWSNPAGRFGSNLDGRFAGLVAWNLSSRWKMPVSRRSLATVPAMNSAAAEKQLSGASHARIPLAPQKDWEGNQPAKLLGADSQF